MDNKTLKEYLEALASGKPTPGGGSAAALAGALGAGLLSMVANFTVGREKYKDGEAAVQGYRQDSERIRERLLSLAHEDTLVYQKVSAAYKLPKELPEDKERRAEAIQSALKKAAGVPLQICRLTHEAVKLCPGLLEKGNPNLISDVGVGVVLLAAAFEAGGLNVEINLKAIKDEKFVAGTNKTLKPLKEEIRMLKETVWHKTETTIGSL